MTRPPLWDWALEAYARPEVKSSLLDLQNRHDTDSCFLLWCAWLDAYGAPSPALLARGAALSDAWRRAVVAPLRAARDAMKPPPAGFDSADASKLRKEVLAAELEAERLQLAALEALAPSSESSAASAVPGRLAAMIEAGRHCGDAPVAELAALLTVLRAG